ncbi:MAG: helix-turn-helix domain-containing protein [Chitinophagaceae bacterium]
MQHLLIQGLSKKEIEDLIGKAVSDSMQKFISSLPGTNQVKQEDKLLTKIEAAKFLRISTVTLNKYLRDGYLKGHTISGTRLRFKQSELEKSFKTLKTNKKDFYGI